MASPAPPPAPLARHLAPTAPAGDARQRMVVAGDLEGAFQARDKTQPPRDHKVFLPWKFSNALG